MTYSHLHALRATAPAKVSYNDGDVRSRNYSWSSSGLTRGSRIPLTLREARLTFQTGPGIIPGHPRAGPSPPAPLPRGEGRSGNRFFPLPWGEGRAQPGVRDSRLRGNDSLKIPGTRNKYMSPNFREGRFPVRPGHHRFSYQRSTVRNAG